MGAQQQLLLGSLPLPPSASGEGSSRPCSFVSVASSENPDWEQLGPVEDLGGSPRPSQSRTAQRTVEKVAAFSCSSWVQENDKMWLSGVRTHYRIVGRLPLLSREEHAW